MLYLLYYIILYYIILYYIILYYIILYYIILYYINYIILYAQINVATTVFCCSKFFADMTPWRNGSSMARYM